jgi:hypothetical protein
MSAVLPVLLGAWLAVWFFGIGALLGGLANVWLHNLTGGAWGEAVRRLLLRACGLIPLASLLFLPILAGMHVFYPWTAQAGGVMRWHDELSAPTFKSLWLSPWFFVARSLAYLLLWNALAWLSLRPGLERSKPFSAGALIVYGFSMSLAAVDWVMSLMPLWYSSVFGWLVGIGQMLAGMALGVACATRRSGPPSERSSDHSYDQPSASVWADLGNLLLMYVLMWAYLAFSQFLIIWAENLPHEIAWYVVRSRGPWPAVAWLLTVFFFFVPLLILLSRRIKRTPGALGALAITLMVLQLIDTCWLVLPSLAVDPVQWLWAVPACGLVAGAIAMAWWRHMPHGITIKGKEAKHA